MPTKIHDELGKDDRFLYKIGLKMMDAASIAGLNFKSNDFFKAASQALNNKSLTISTYDTKNQDEFRPSESNPNSFLIYIPKEEKEKIIYDISLLMLKNSPSKREQILNDNKTWLDFADQDFEKMVAKIVTLQNPSNRVKELSSIWRSSLPVFYHDLEQKFMKKTEFQFNELIPFPNRDFLRYFRLNNNKSNKDFQQELQKVTKILLNEIGVIEATYRLWDLPINLPDIIFDSLRNLSYQDRNKTLLILKNMALTPLAKSHFLKILKTFVKENDQYSEIIQDVFKQLVNGNGIDDVNAFYIILKWANYEFCHFDEFLSLPPHIRLTILWSYSNKLFTIFIKSGAPSSWLHKIFKEQIHQKISSENLLRNSEYYLDIAHPLHINAKSLLFDLLYNGLGDKIETYIDDEIKSFIQKILILEIEGNKYLNPDIGMDSSLAKNSINSFLDLPKNIVMTPIIGNNEAETFSNESRKQLVYKSINNLLNKKEQSNSWLTLVQIIRFLPPSAEYGELLISKLLKTNYKTLCKSNMNIGKLAIQISSHYAMHIKNDKLNKYLLDQIIKVSVFFQDWETNKIKLKPNEKEKIITDNLIIIDSALNISLANNSESKILAEFVNTLSAMVNNWDHIIPYLEFIVQRLIEELPISKAEIFWPLYIRLRAE